MRILMTALLLLVSGQVLAQTLMEPALFMATMNQAPIDFKKPTRLIFAGPGGTIGTLFQAAATGRVRKYLAVEPNQQVVFVSSNERRNGFSNRSHLINYGYQILAEDPRPLTANMVVEVSGRFDKIKSFEIFSHAATNVAILSANVPGVEALKSKFTKDAFAVFYGCNAGYTLARDLSNLWGIPAAGALTSADFEKLHSLNQFYRYEESAKPTSGDWVTRNLLSFLNPLTCVQGACIRMKADDFPYSGVHGQYSRGLPYYKFYCLGKTTEAQCYQARAKWTLGVLSTLPLKPTSTKEEYRKVVIDALCPNRSGKEVRAECNQQLRSFENTEVEQSYSPFLGPMLDCNLRDCDQNPNSTSSKSFVREYKYFMKAFPYLAAPIRNSEKT